MHTSAPGFPPVFIFFFVAFAIAVLVLIIRNAVRGSKRKMNPGNNQQHNMHFDNNSITHNPATWGAADAFNNQDMNNEMNTNGTSFSDKDHDGIPDQVDTHDNRFDHTMSNDSTSSFDTNTWSNDSSSGGFDSGGSSGGSTDSNNNF